MGYVGSEVASYDGVPIYYLELDYFISLVKRSNANKLLEFKLRLTIQDYTFCRILS